MRSAPYASADKAISPVLLVESKKLDGQSVYASCLPSKRGCMRPIIAASLRTLRPALHCIVLEAGTTFLEGHFASKLVRQCCVPERCRIE